MFVNELIICFHSNTNPLEKKLVLWTSIVDAGYGLPALHNLKQSQPVGQSQNWIRVVSGYSTSSSTRHYLILAPRQVRVSATGPKKGFAKKSTIAKKSRFCTTVQIAEKISDKILEEAIWLDLRKNAFLHRIERSFY